MKSAALLPRSLETRSLITDVIHKHSSSIFFLKKKQTDSEFWISKCNSHFSSKTGHILSVEDKLYKHGSHCFYN